MDEIDSLRRDIALCESELADLRSQLALAESSKRAEDTSNPPWKWPLTREEYDRYGRQMIVPKFGLHAQQRLKSARVLIVGAGGLGCPAAAYLAGAGVGTLGVIDGDHVETSNLHRQIAHSTSRVGLPKVQSLVTYLRELNPTVTYHSHHAHLTTENAEDVVRQYDYVLDCTDHPTSRYLVSDVCVLLGKTLISASAFQVSGQLVMLNDPPGQGPCYRCVFPRPPPPESVIGCGEGGILGPVVGVMGVLQALEAVKAITRVAALTTTTETPGAGRTNTMTIFSAMNDAAPFRSVNMRARRKDCFACGEGATLTLESLKNSMDYVQFCGVAAPLSLLESWERLTAEEYDMMTKDGAGHVLLDVREKEHFDMYSLEGSVNIPISRFTEHRGDEVPDWVAETIASEGPIYIVCRVGNDSQVAALKLKQMGLGQERPIKDIKGGLKAWKETLDPSIPFT